MANRVGIELLPYVCRIVEIREKTVLFGRSRTRIGETRVHSFRDIPYNPSSPAKLTADLRQALKGRGALARHARVALWGLKSTHLGLLLPPAAEGDLLALARRESRVAEGNQPPVAKTSPFWSDGISVGEVREGGRREVGYVSANPEDVKARLQPFIAAGFEIDAVVTPALAHSVLVRQRWSTSPDQVTAVVSIDAKATAITVLRGTVVLFARELPWGFDAAPAGHAGVAYDSAATAAKLASELKRSLVFIKQSRQVDVSHVLVCGDIPDLRSLTAPLMRELNVEVETLDGLEGLDVARLPEPIDAFRAKVAALRTAIGIAAETTLPIDLQPRAPGVSVAVTRGTQRRMIAAAIVSCAVIGAIWSGARYLQGETRARVASLRQQIGQLEPEVQRQEQARQAAVTRSTRLAALEAFASQGPRLGLVLDAFRRAPYDMTMNSLQLTSSPAGVWRLAVDGQAKSRTTADAQASFSTFLKTASASKYLGLPVRSPEIAIHIEEAPSKSTTEATGSQGAAGNTRTLRIEDIPPIERPRGVDIVRVERVPIRDVTGRVVNYTTKFIVALPSYMPRTAENIKRINDYNRRWDNVTETDPYLALRASASKGLTQAPAPELPPSPPFVGTVLDFALTFEVKK